MKEFIKQALRDRYDQFVGSDEILDEFIDDLAELCGDCWIREWDTARTIIDNWYVNGERWDYEEYWNDYMNETEEFDAENEEQLEKIEENMMENGYYYKRDKLIRTSM